MSYRLAKQNPIPREMARIAHEQASRALIELHSVSRQDADGIHQARKHFKKIRALLRLVRSELPAFSRRQETVFRNTGQHLAAFRDTDATLEIFSVLNERYPRRFQRHHITQLHSRLQQRRSAIAQGGLDLPRLAQQLARTTERARSQFAPLRRSSISAEGIFDEFLKGYAQARRHFHKARHSPEPEILHAFRTRAKRLWYFSRLFQDVRPSVLKPLRKKLRHLAELLGQLHDLDLLEKALEAVPSDDRLAKPKAALLECANSHRRLLLKKTFRLSARLFKPPRKEVRSRLSPHWKRFL